MSDVINVLVVEDDAETCRGYKMAIEKYDNLSLSGITNNSSDALILTQKYNPDAVILDLELNLGSGSGIEYLLGLPSLSLKQKPYILVVTNNVSHVTHEIIRKIGTDFLVTKVQNKFTEKAVINLLLSLLKIKQLPYSVNDTYIAENKSKRAETLRSKIKMEFDSIGISPKLKGRQYLLEAIELTAGKRIKKISSVIAEQHGKTYTSVERAMETAINKAWRTTDIETLEKYYTAYINPSKGVPTVTEFIYYYADKIFESVY